MLTGTALMNELVDELNELKLSTMAATLDDLYHRPGFLEMDRLTLIAELIGPQFQEKVSTTLKNRLTAAHLKGSPEELADCVDSDKREYLPAGITEVLFSLDFIERGYNLCILGESDAGKSYLAKAIGIKSATGITSVTSTARSFWKAW
ncbi:ATP-binding protein [Roseburia intestinalis]|uniref:ATP-binding protein n=1 Tax=Roseburia intestinalis TaxID=166486 RepID=UPI0021A48AE0|nr:ATP-binding protein [Roseburia intestinalis]UWP55935.1 ATP-binding protein [Roseburia intestinalis]